MPEPRRTVRLDWNDQWEEGLPRDLWEMRMVKAFPWKPPNPCPTEEVCLVGLRQLYESDQMKFRAAKEALESRFLEWKTARENARAKEAEAQIKSQAPATAPSEWNGKGPCPVCKHEALLSDEECVEKVERWLAEQTK